MMTTMLDTSPAMQRRYDELLRARLPHQRLATALALTRAAQGMTRAGIRLRFPNASPCELEARYAAQVYGVAVARRLFPDVDVDGR